MALTEGPWGVWMPDEVARALEIRRRCLPAEFRDRLLRRSVDRPPLKAGERQEDSWISTDAVDRHGDVVLAGGMDDRAFALNPVVTWQHAYDRPAVGRSVWRQVTDRAAGQGVLARTHYPTRPVDYPPGEGWMPDVAWGLLRGGLLSGKSIGFVPARARALSRGEREARPDWAGARQVISEWVLVEYACVTLPANPQTLLAGATPPGRLGDQLGNLLVNHSGRESR